MKTDTGLTELFNIITGVRQGCILSPFLFLLIIDFLMRQAINGTSHGITWTSQSRITDLDFVDDIKSASRNKMYFPGDDYKPENRSRES